MKMYDMRRVLHVLGIGAVTLSPGAPLPVMAQSVRPQPVADSAPNAKACEALGFKTPYAETEQVVVSAQAANRRAPRIQGRPPVSAPADVAPPPPLPIPPVERRVEMPAPPVITQAPRAPQPLGLPPVPSPSRAQNTEQYPNVASNGVKQTASEPVSTFSIDVDTAAYANVRRFLKDGVRPPTDAVRVEELLNYFDYGYSLPASRQKPFEPYVAVAPSPWSQGRQLIHIGLQGYRTPSAQRPPVNLVFLLDTSGSMNSADRLPLAKKAMNLLIDQLGANDRVSIVAYAGSAGAVLAPTAGTQKLKMRCALEALESGGSTAGGAGLALAYDLAQQNFNKDAVNRIVLMTDGDFNVGTTDNARLEDFVAAKRKTGIYLSVYGFGRGNYQDERMQALAQNGNGTAAYIDTLDEARKLFRDDFSSSIFPIADDVKIQVEFNPAQVSEYRLIGYETRMLAREDFNNDQVDAGEVGSGASVTALYEITPVGGPTAADSLRYGGSPAPAAGQSQELAFLKVRYKPPSGGTSILMDRPIGPGDVRASLAAAPEATRFAVAVAAFGQKLKRDPRFDAGYGWADIRSLAQGARGADPFGLRAEFVQLTRSAEEVDRP